MKSAAYREGEIVVDGETHNLILVDYNNNGRFDDQVAVMLGRSVRPPRIRLNHKELWRSPDMLRPKYFAY